MYSMENKQLSPQKGGWEMLFGSVMNKIYMRTLMERLINDLNKNRHLGE